MAAPATSYASFRRSLIVTGDEVAHLVTLAFGATVVLITVLLVWNLWGASAASRSKFGIGFLWGTNWDPNANDFGALPFIYGTVMTSLMALVLSVPLGVGAAIFLAEMAPPGLSSACTFLVELLAAVPSVIYGMLAIFTVVPLMHDYVEPALKGAFGYLPQFQGPMLGVGYLTAAVVLVGGGTPTSTVTAWFLILAWSCSILARRSAAPACTRPSAARSLRVSSAN